MAKAAPATTARVAVATGHTGALPVTAEQNIGRLRSEVSVAALCTAEGKTKTEIIRCLKRCIARELHHTLLADLTPAPASPPRSAPIASITRGAGPIAQTIRS